MQRGYLMGFDVGTGGSKGVLVSTDGRVLATCFRPYPVHYPHPGWAEQRAEDWWEAVGEGAKDLLSTSGISAREVIALGFAGQMLGLVPVDRSLKPLRPAIIWLDSRAGEEARKIVRRLGGEGVVRRVAGAVPSGKDVVCKILWLRRNEPEAFENTWKFLDTTGYLVMRATGRAVIDHTGAGGTGILDGKRRRWSRPLAYLAGVPLEKMPDVRGCAEVVGTLTGEAAHRMGLVRGTPVIAGMADIPAAAVGSGALEDGDAHINIGTSSWLCLTIPEARSLGGSGFASVVSADPEKYLLIGESETAGACLEWFAEQLWEQSPPNRIEVARPDESLYVELDRRVEEVEPGAERLLFVPWLFGERAPVTDTLLRGAFVNLSLQHSREHMLRAVYEGVAYNLRWLLDVVEKGGWPCSVLRAIGGGARSDVWMQMVADVTGRRVEALEHPREAGAVGCALVAGLGVEAVRSFPDIKELVRIRKSFSPREDVRSVYDRMYAAFLMVYPRLSRICAELNRGASDNEGLGSFGKESLACRASVKHRDTPSKRRDGSELPEQDSGRIMAWRG